MQPAHLVRFKILVLAVSLLWLAAWGVAGALAGVETWTLGVYALVVLAFGVSGWLGFRPGPARWLAAGATLVLAAALVRPTFMDLRVLAGALGVLASIVLPPRRDADADTPGSTGPARA